MNGCVNKIVLRLHKLKLQIESPPNGNTEVFLSILSIKKKKKVTTAIFDSKNSRDMQLYIQKIKKVQN